jgi:hypothetical protein
MSWIRKHWEREYVADAVDMIKNLVRFFGVSRKITYFGMQMQEYHGHSQEEPVTHVSVPQVPAQSWESLALQYGIEDMMDIGGNIEQLEQTVDEEFTAYTSSTSPKHTDIIKFWEVSHHGSLRSCCVTSMLIYR